MKKIILVLLIAILLVGCGSLNADDNNTGSNNNEAVYQDGTYEAQTQGHNGPLSVTTTIEGGKITKVEVGENSETEDLAGPAFDEITAKIVEANSADVDVVSGATVSSNALIDAVKDTLNQASHQ